MVDPETFLTTLYVKVDDFDKAYWPPPLQPGPEASLSRSEVVTLALFGQWANFLSERAFYRYAERHLRGLFPRLPARTQFNRLLREHASALTEFSLDLARELQQPTDAYQALDATAIVVRDSRRRGTGWLAGQADIGYSPRLGWYEGFRLLVAVLPSGVITGWGFGAASAKEQPLAQTFLAARAYPQPALASVGAPAQGPYLTDTGFEGVQRAAHWRAAYGATVISPPKRSRKKNWPKPWRRYLASLRQLIESVNEKLLHSFRLSRERPHALAGLLARLAAKAAVHNFCIWLNQQLGRPKLAFADLIAW